MMILTYNLDLYSSCYRIRVPKRISLRILSNLTDSEFCSLIDSMMGRNLEEVWRIEIEQS